jgi:hypothetical protein
MVKDACKYTIVNDGQFMWPVLTADVERAGQTQSDVRDMSEDTYTAWCDALPSVAEGSVGSQACIDLCRQLIEAGARVWHVG